MSWLTETEHCIEMDQAQVSSVKKNQKTLHDNETQKEKSAKKTKGISSYVP